MQNLASFPYRMMVWIMKLQDIFKTPGEILLQFGIEKGMTVVDYGCGPGRYLEKASGLAGETGTVYAADINATAIGYVNDRIRRLGLKNIIPVQIGAEGAGIPPHCADVVYALDMFHMVDDPAGFLAAVHGTIKRAGSFISNSGTKAAFPQNKKSRSLLYGQLTQNMAST
jgi:ubiquinone/menaquinone biosynthesis C-methylase UbiE